MTRIESRAAVTALNQDQDHVRRDEDNWTPGRRDGYQHLRIKLSSAGPVGLSRGELLLLRAALSAQVAECDRVPGARSLLDKL